MAVVLKMTMPLLSGNRLLLKRIRLSGYGTGLVFKGISFPQARQKSTSVVV